MELNRKNRIKNPDIGYITIDSEGCICSCNDLAATLLGSESSQLLNTRLVDVIASDNRFAPLAKRLKEPEKTVQNEQFDLP
ncbi:MAG: PAS domain-containing protein, partial [Desulfofustis sp.]|nr:PAS domain-containing protein [Desulfofustis sp.]